jgi:steroid delta-isomerase-like uncharacterized protein
MSAEQNKSIVYRWVEAAWNHGDFSQSEQIYPSTYLLHDTSSPEPFRGPAGLRGFISAFRTAMPDLHMTIEQIVAEGDMVAWRFRAQGTQTGALQGIPASGRVVDITGEVFSRFSDGRWVEDYSNADQLTMLQQMGVIPQPGSAG